MKSKTFSGVGLFKSFAQAQKDHEKALRKLKRQQKPKIKVAKSVQDGSTKVIVIYSGKGGVGKTTTTANLARTFLQKGNKVAIVDGDVNTPSMGVIFKKDNPVDNLLVCSMGYESNVFIQTSRIREFFRLSITQVVQFKPDFLLIDTPPSITDVHLGLLETFKPSGLILVTQPTKLSWEDVSRTVWLFEQRSVPILGVVRSMVTPQSPATITRFPILADIKFHSSFNGSLVLSKNMAAYNSLAKAVENVEAVVLENRKRVLFDETPIDLGIEISKKGFHLKFINLSSWPRVREALIAEQENVFGLFPMGITDVGDGRSVRPYPHDRFLDECTEDRVNRLVKAFEFDEEAYFMVTNAPNTEIHLIPGEIGRCRMRQHPGYYNVPVVDYHTSDGVVTLFPFEVTPVTDSLIRDNTLHGGKPLKDGRYLPGLGTARELYYTFGNRIGFLENWPEHYAHWAGEFTAEEISFLNPVEA